MTTEDAGPGRRPTACRSCGSDHIAFRGTKHGTFLGRDFGFWHCASCDFLFVDPFPGYAVYNEDYYSGRGADPYVDYESEYRDYRATDRLAEFDDLRRVALGVLSGNASAGPVEWLDFGCGAGGLLKYLREAGDLPTGRGMRPVRLAGHDVGTYAQRLREQDGFRILDSGQLAAEPRESYDIISMIEVIEHVEFPDPVFALAARLLKPGGLLLLTTGNIASPVARWRGLSYAYLLPEIHVGYFTPLALESAYRRHGLLPVRFRYAGAVRFKVIKTLRKASQKRVARWALNIPLAVRAVDWLFGTSAMPCARRPL